MSFLQAVNDRSAATVNLTAIICRLSSTISDERQAALETLAVLYDPSIIHPHLKHIVMLLSDEEAEICFAAAGLLCSVPSSALAPYTEEVLHQFEKVPNSVRWRVVECLAKIEPSTLALHIAGVAQLIRSSDDDVRRRAVELLANVSDLDKHAAAVLPMIEGDEDEDCRLSAIELLGKLSPPHIEQYRDVLLRVMKSDAEACCRATAVAVLGSMVPSELAQHTALVLACLDDESWRVRRHAMEVLGVLPASVLVSHAERVLDLLDSSDPRVREWGLAAFGKLSSSLDPPTATAIASRLATAIEARLQDEDRRVRERAQALRTRMGGSAPGTPHATPSLPSAPAALPEPLPPPSALAYP